MFQTPVLFSFACLPPASTLVRVFYLYPHSELRDSRKHWINTPGAWQGHGIPHWAPVYCLLLQKFVLGKVSLYFLLLDTSVSLCKVPQDKI